MSGELDFRLEDDVVRAGPSGWLFVSGGRPHTFSNPTGAVARMLVTLTPGGFERFFRDMAAAAQQRFPVAASCISHKRRARDRNRVACRNRRVAE